jgi:hypothetical protein
VMWSFRRWVRIVIGVVFVGALLLSPAIAAQDDVSGHSWSVFVRHDIDYDGHNELIFVDVVTGDEVSVTSYGERYIVAGDGVVFYDPVNSRMMLATPDGSLREHPFIQVAPGTHRLEWVISDDGRRIAWTLTRFDSQNRLATVTTVANIDGTDRRVVLNDVDTTGSNMRVFPVAFSSDAKTLYIDNAHVDGITAYIAFAQYVNIHALNLETGEMTLLPGEQGNCICGAALDEGLLLRLRLPDDLVGFDLHVHDLGDSVTVLDEASYVIPALRLTNYDDTAGDVLIAPDGTKAVYALAQLSDYGTTQQPIRTVFVLVDLEAMTQDTLTTPLTTFVHPVEWTEDNSAIIFTSSTQDGTWKIRLSDGRLDRIAEAAYIGTLIVTGDE